MESDNKFDIDPNCVAFAFTKKTFSLILLPTEQCNFRCTYCYEDYKIGHMTAETIARVKKLIYNLINSNPELEVFSLAWFGGEPLLVKDIVCDILSYTKKLCNKHGIELTSNINTNGYLLDKKHFKKLLSLNLIQYQISLDGPQEIHDLTRIKADGAGTFDVIWNNLLHMRESKSKFGVTIRLHLSPENKPHIEKLINQLGEVFADDERFSVFIRKISNLGGGKSSAIKTVDNQEKNEVISKMHNLLRAKKLKIYVSPPYSEICYASMSTRLVIRADGSIAKCTVAFHDDVNRLGKLKEDGTVEIDDEKLNFWFRGFKTLDKKVLSCPYFSYKGHDNTCKEKSAE